MFSRIYDHLLCLFFFKMEKLFNRVWRMFWCRALQDSYFKRLHQWWFAVITWEKVSLSAGSWSLRRCFLEAGPGGILVGWRGALQTDWTSNFCLVFLYLLLISWMISTSWNPITVFCGFCLFCFGFFFKRSNVGVKLQISYILAVFLFPWLCWVVKTCVAGQVTEQMLLCTQVRGSRTVKYPCVF